MRQKLQVFSLTSIQIPRPIRIFSARYNFLNLELESFAAAHKNSFNITSKRKERASPIWETSSLLYFDSFCSNEIIQRLELQLLQLLRQEPQFQQQPS